MTRVQGTPLSQTVTDTVDAALDAMRDRTTVSTYDVTDLLLDLRISLRETVQLEEANAARVDQDRRPRSTWGAAAIRAGRLGNARRPGRHLPTLFRSRSF